jgi:spectinomycin phosphotransferase
VVTHGEPHAGNVLRTPGGELLLVDWDTVGLAPPERDLWHVCRDTNDYARYTEASGRRVDPRAIDLYRLRWQLDDVAIFASDLRSPHVRSGDTERALDGLNVYLRTDGGGS